MNKLYILMNMKIVNPVLIAVCPMFFFFFLVLIVSYKCIVK